MGFVAKRRTSRSSMESLPSRKVGGWRKGEARVMTGQRGDPAGSWARGLPGTEMSYGLICVSVCFSGCHPLILPRFVCSPAARVFGAGKNGASYVSWARAEESLPVGSRGQHRDFKDHLEEQACREYRTVPGSKGDFSRLLS